MTDDMNRYKFRKSVTALRLVQLFKNWPTAFRLWLGKRRTDVHPARLLRMRSGLNFSCREGTSDWNTIMEIFVADEYRLAFDYLNRAPGRPVVVDLGANIGLFSLACAHRNRAAIVEAYEPAPPNCDQFRANLSLNESLSERVALRQAAVGPETGNIRLSYEESAPASANVFTSAGKLFDVEVVSLKDVLIEISGRVDLLKIDIEGAEYELLRGSDRDLWGRIDAIALELHDDPLEQMSRSEFLEQMSSLGFQARKGPFISFLLTR